MHPPMSRSLALAFCAALGLGELLARTGVAVPELATLDTQIPSLMARDGIPGAAVALVKDGRLVFARGYGVANTQSGELVQPDSLFRVGSISKTITAVTLLHLWEQGQINLDAKAYAEILADLQPPPGSREDSRLKDVTVRQLLHHTGGHGRDTGTDPLYTELAMKAADAFHVPKPPGYETIVRYARALPLDFDPGTRYSYSNFGFTVLARVVEHAAGQPYESYVRQNILLPMGITRMALGQTLPENRLPGEVTYYDPRGPWRISIFPEIRHLMPAPYAQFQVEAGDGSGRWVASAIDLARFVSRVSGLRAPAFLQPETFALLLERPNPFVSQDNSGNSWYGMGAAVGVLNGGLYWGHDGSYPGSYAGYLALPNGFVYAFGMNTAPSTNSTTVADFENILIAIGNHQQNWPAQDLFPQYYPEP